MKKHSIITLIVFFIFSGISAQNYKGDYTPDIIPEDLKEDAEAVIQFSHREINLSKNGYSQSEKVIVTVLKKNSYYENITVFYNKFIDVESFKVNVYDANGKLIYKGKKDIEDLSLTDNSTIASDSRIKRVTTDHIRLPYTIAYEYKVNSNSNFLLNSWRPQPSYDIAVMDAHCTIVVPDEINITSKTKNIDADKKQVLSKGKYSWNVENKQALLWERYGAISDETFPSLSFSPDQITLGRYSGKSSTWQEYGKFYYNLNEDHNNISTELKSTISTLVPTELSTKEKVDAVYNYLQENTRYVSIQLGTGGWKTLPGSFVEKNNYGDCKALTFYMKSLLNTVGVDAVPALIENGSKPSPIDEDFVDIPFNHIILYVPDEELWLECTSSSLRPGQIGYSNSDRKALLIKEEGGELINTPKASVEKIDIENLVSLNLDKGKSDVSITMNTEGPFMESMQGWKHFYSDQDIEDRLIKMVEYTASDIKSTSINIEAEKAIANMEFSIENLYSKSGKRIFLPAQSILGLFSNKQEKEEERKQDIHLEKQKDFSEKTIITLPEMYEVESLPKNISVESDFGNYTITFTKEEGKIIITKKAQFNKGKYSKDSYEDFYQFHQDISQSEQVKIVLVQVKP